MKTLSILAVAGSALAAPQWPGWSGNYFGGSNDNHAGQGGVATDYEVVTAYTTVTAAGQWGGGNNWPGQASPTAAPVAAYTPAPQAPSPVAAASSQVAQAAPSGTGEAGYMAIVNEWRGKMGMSDLTWDQTLQNNDLKTVNDDKGTMTHELNPGSFAQVLAPGTCEDSAFEKVFVGGWLCEIPSLPGLDGICNTMSQGWAYDGQTGHADILTSKAYSKIGCACAYGIWGCDLA